MVIIDLRKRKLESIEKEGDFETVLAKLIDQAASLNMQRFKYAIEIKVKLPLVSGLLLFFWSDDYAVPVIII